MPRDRFVDPQTTKIDLSDDDWIIVKHRITEGERLRLEGATLARVRRVDGDGDEGPEIGLDWARFRLQRIVTWVVEWSFARKGKIVPVTRESVAALDPETATEIHEALDRHIEAIGEAKKARQSETASGST